MDPRSQEFVDKIGNLLISKGVLDQNAFNRACRAKQETHERFDHILTRLGLVSEIQLLETLSEQLSMISISKDDYPVEAVLNDDLQIEFLKANKILPISETDSTLTLAIGDPFNKEAVEAIAYLIAKNVECRLALSADIDAALEKLYSGEESQRHSDIYMEDGYSSDEDVERLRDLASEAPVIQLVNQLIRQAVEQGASDIHIEPLEDILRVRFRIDGVMNEVSTFPLSMQSAIATRIKILGKLNIAERRLPQDGRVKIAVRGQDIDIRLSTAPTYNGESIVLRILDQGSLALNFKTLGFYGDSLEKYSGLLEEPNGIVLVTGPTGSGKTTTLYASLSKLNSDTHKIFTVEDPVEYQLQGINQLQVQPKVGLTFASALRSILRQDPDIIMIGEIRDIETAQIAIQSSLTGHMVLSTLHTNSAAATVTRLLDMGMEDYLLASTIKGIMAQRLVRTLCNCAESVTFNEEMIAKFSPHPVTLECVDRQGGMNLKRPVGCPECNQTGYKGRTTIMELLVMNEPLQQAVLASKSHSEIEKVAIQSGMKTLYQDGLVKAFRGETTVEEILRVVQGV